MAKKNYVISNLQKAIVKIAKSSAITEANTACAWFAYQPREPQNLKLLRRF